MTELHTALAELAEALEACSLPYMLIGGLAVAAWGEPRSTLDIDVSAWAETDRLPEAVNCLAERFQCRSARPLAFVQETRVLPLESAAGVRMDIFFGVLPFQRDAIRRAIRKDIVGRIIPVASIEDLFLMKIVSERAKDLADAKALLHRFGSAMDRAYLMPKLKELAEALSRPDIVETIQKGIV